ncbi:hypothetical protein DSO57_1000469 [Entomophthora muscae]|uniref:Uncharacterized protein n=1 Tax=Entomophthora muscae TaxID=34485 RepID=A0ACC2UUU1_9FUNG|nr:hypothetical protein DSO57_1000469 [Entomophthora muscae]
METAATRKEVPTSSLEEAWESLEVTKTVPEESLVEVKAAFKELYSNYFAKEGTHAKGNQIYAWDFWNLLVGWDKILQQVKAKENCKIEALRAREEKSVEIIDRWRDDNKVLSHKIASLETKLLEALSKEGNDNKSQGQDNGRMDWLDLDLSHFLVFFINYCSQAIFCNFFLLDLGSFLISQLIYYNFPDVVFKLNNLMEG